jgi:hypothetical protein
MPHFEEALWENILVQCSRNGTSTFAFNCDGIIFVRRLYMAPRLRDTEIFDLVKGAFFSYGVSAVT